MAITRLDIHCIRNLSNVFLCPSTSLNIIYGLNGSGKTSILEAINILSIGRSFRTHKISTVIQHGSESITLFAHSQTEAEHHAIGVQKSNKRDVVYKLDGINVHSQSQIASLLPTKAITTGLHALLEDTPDERRSYLDWGLFHVEPAFIAAYQTFKRILYQRNALLKNNDPQGLAFWDQQFVESATAIHNLRTEYIASLQPYLEVTLATLLDMASLEMSYRQGWNSELSLKEALNVSRETDLKRGFTSVGPHRADFQFRVDGYTAVDHLSRGQEKLFIIGLHIAQVLHLFEHRDLASIVLIDDIASEMDGFALQKVLKLLAKCKTQIFITVIDKDDLNLSGWEEKKLFHVEHGCVQEVI